jgi:hypothetical protein
MIIIGLIGPAGAGKSTVAAMLGEYGARRYAFAEPLKQMVKAAFQLTDEQLYGTQAQKETVDLRYGLSGRQLLQRVGQGIRDTFGPDFWWQYLADRLRKERPEIAVIEDVRYMNEASGILGHNFAAPIREKTPSVYMWRIESPGRESLADASHQSEAEWDRCSFTHVIRPEVRDLQVLGDIVRATAEQCGLV